MILVILLPLIIGLVYAERWTTRLLLFTPLVSIATLFYFSPHIQGGRVGSISSDLVITLLGINVAVLAFCLYFRARRIKDQKAGKAAPRKASRSFGQKFSMTLIILMIPVGGLFVWLLAFQMPGDAGKWILAGIAVILLLRMLAIKQIKGFFSK